MAVLFDRKTFEMYYKKAESCKDDVQKHQREIESIASTTRLAKRKEKYFKERVALTLRQGDKLNKVIDKMVEKDFLKAKEIKKLDKQFIQYKNPYNYVLMIERQYRESASSSARKRKLCAETEELMNPRVISKIKPFSNNPDNAGSADDVQIISD